METGVGIDGGGGSSNDDEDGGGMAVGQAASGEGAVLGCSEARQVPRWLGGGRISGMVMAERG